jgi:DNA-binding HxlR family transcriptional regulator
MADQPSNGAPGCPPGLDGLLPSADLIVMGCKVRQVLSIVADKWSLYLVSFLGDGPRRFTELKRGIEGISQRMLTVTLRSLERDGIVLRTAYDVMPPRVSYELTDMGRSLLVATTPLLEWSLAHLPSIDDARSSYDARTGAEPANLLAPSEPAG